MVPRRPILLAGGQFCKTQKSSSSAPIVDHAEYPTTASYGSLGGRLHYSASVKHGACDCRYVVRTSQRLQDRINQHIPRCIRSDKRPTKNLPNRECKITSTTSVYCDSAIGQHLLENEECAKHFNDAQFSIWLQQDLRSIYQFWKQLTSNLYSLFFAVKKNSFIHSKFHINFFHFSDKTETIFVHQSNCQNDQF